jgi:hypothetical protein
LFRLKDRKGNKNGASFLFWSIIMEIYNVRLVYLDVELVFNVVESSISKCWISNTIQKTKPI